MFETCTAGATFFEVIDFKVVAVKSEGATVNK